MPLITRDWITLFWSYFIELITYLFPSIFDFSLCKFQYIWLFLIWKLLQTFDYSRYFPSPHPPPRYLGFFLEGGGVGMVGVVFFVSIFFWHKYMNSGKQHSKKRWFCIPPRTAGFCEVWTNSFWNLPSFWNSPSQTWEQKTDNSLLCNKIS